MKILLPSICLVALLQVATAEVASVGLSDPALQPKFTEIVPNPLDPNFIYDTSNGSIQVSVSEGTADTGLVDGDGNRLTTPIWGYGTPELGYTWPGRTFVVESNEMLKVRWMNDMPIEGGYLLTGKNNGELGDYSDMSVVDTSFHWAYR